MEFSYLKDTYLCIVRERVKTIAPDKLKDVLITKTAIKTLKSEDLVERVIMHQFKSARDAFRVHNEIEISGFGKFTISTKRLRLKKLYYENIINVIERRLEYSSNLPEWRIKQYNLRLGLIKEDLEYLKTKRA